MAITKSGVQFTGLKEAMTELNKKLREVEGRTAAGVKQAAAETMREAKRLVPVATGNLRASGYVIVSHKQSDDTGGDFQQDGTTTQQYSQLKEQHGQVVGEAKGTVEKLSALGPVAELGFSAIYALKVHENPEAGKQGNRNKRTGTGKPTGWVRYANTGQWKFLENAVKENEKEIVDIVARNARKAV